MAYGAGAQSLNFSEADGKGPAVGKQKSMASSEYKMERCGRVFCNKSPQDHSTHQSCCKMAAAATMQARSLDYDSPVLFEGPPSSQKKLENQSKPSLLGFPSRYTGERVWTGSDMSQRQDEWTTVLSEQDHNDIVKALRFFQGEKQLPFIP